MHEYRSKEELKGLGYGVWNSGGGVHRLGPSERQHLQSVEEQEPEIRSSSLPPSEPNSGQGSEIKHWQAFSIDWYGKENFRAAQQESTGSIKQRMGSEIVADGQRSGTIHRTEIGIAPKKILNCSVIEGVTEIVQTREPAWCGGNNQDERGYEVVPPGNGMRRIRLRPIVGNSGSFVRQIGVSDFARSSVIPDASSDKSASQPDGVVLGSEEILA